MLFISARSFCLCSFAEDDFGSLPEIFALMPSYKNMVSLMYAVIVANPYHLSLQSSNFSIIYRNLSVMRTLQHKDNA